MYKRQDEKWAYAFDPGQLVADFVTGVVIGEILDGIMACLLYTSVDTLPVKKSS